MNEAERIYDKVYERVRDVETYQCSDGRAFSDPQAAYVYQAWLDSNQSLDTFAEVLKLLAVDWNS